MLKYLTKRAVCLPLALFLCVQVSAQAPQKLWHNKERTLNYHPDGEDIVIVNGKHRFNRAVYGTNTAFRVEGGDLPEFALYLPGMGGNLRFGLITGDKSKWLIDAEHIEMRYRAGSVLYTITDPSLGKGSLKLSLLAGAATESMIVKAEFTGVDNGAKLFWAFGGATGKKFSRDGDIGADPESSFYLKPEYCKGNSFQISNTSFALKFTGKASSDADRYEIKQGANNKADEITAQKGQVTGLFPIGAELRVADASKQSSPLEFWDTKAADAPAITGIIKPTNAQPLYFLISSPAEKAVTSYAELPGLFNAAEAARKKVADRIKVNTPDPYINTLGGVLAIAADAIWESPSFMHGSVAWRMRLNAWRGPYVADVLGWHDRARSHFSSYALSQVTSPEIGPNRPDSAMHFARQQEKMGNAMFSSGYISRNPGGKLQPHHYDMNLVFIDALLNHFNWTGDRDYVKQMWPVIKRHLAWEKRNFDADGDGLYDAYCAIWASDALQYSGGGVTHTSAYNYRANKMAAQLAKIAGEDGTPYQKEADHILNAVNKTLWLPQTGQYAEFQDLLGNKLIHPSAALWTVYHAIDEGISDKFQAYQATRYIDTQIPHIPIIAKGVPESWGLYTLSTSNWMPYDWSLNNVVLAEELHTSLAYWQAGRANDAFKLWKGSLMESQYLESSPGNFENMSFYDAARGEAYRDFGDPIGMAGRSLIEGLFGIHPDALNGKLMIKPGFPSDWDHASIHTPDIQFDFKRTGGTDAYDIALAFPKKMNLVLQLPAQTSKVKIVFVNGQKVNWENIAGVGKAILQISAPVNATGKYHIVVDWDTSAVAKFDNVMWKTVASPKSDLSVFLDKAQLVDSYDPENGLKAGKAENVIFGKHTFFELLKQGDLSWWVPITFEAKPLIEILDGAIDQSGLKFKVQMNADRWTSPGALLNFDQKVTVNSGKGQYVADVKIQRGVSDVIDVPLSDLILGSNIVKLEREGKVIETTITNWNIQKAPSKQETINLTTYFNDQVTNIFKNKYLSPRPTSPTLQLPWQGIGNWCYPLVEANIDDSGLRKAAGDKNEYITPQGLKFATPGKAGEKNILFTSQWDNYPKQAEVPLSGKASHAYFLMAGSTNPMQSRLVNGEVVVTYTDNTTAVLELKNPQTWWPIEQDYEDDGYAFQLNAARPIRVYLKSGTAATEWNNFKGIKGFANRGIDGGAGTILDLPLDATKELKSLRLRTIANDVVIGLMGVTLVRE